MNVLAHIVLNSDGVAPEPAATKAFAFILRSGREAGTQYDAVDAAFAEDFAFPSSIPSTSSPVGPTTLLPSTPPS